MNRAARLKLLAAEDKTFDEPLFVVVINALLETLATHQERFQTKNAVLAQFRLTLKACRKASSADKDKVCGWLEKVLEIQGLESSDGMLEAWVNDIPY
jgi:hypothetical protein